MDKEEKEQKQSFKEILQTEKHKEQYVSKPYSFIRAFNERDRKAGSKIADLLFYYVDREHVFRDKLDNGRFYVLQKEIEEDLGYNIEQLRRFNRALEDLKLISIIRKGNYNWYKLNWENLLDLKDSIKTIKKEIPSFKKGYKKVNTLAQEGVNSEKHPRLRHDRYSKRNNSSKRNYLDKSFDSKTPKKKNFSLDKSMYEDDMPKRKRNRNAKRDKDLEYLIKLADSGDYPGMPKMLPNPDSDRYGFTVKFFESLRNGKWSKYFKLDPLWYKDYWIKDQDKNYKFTSEEIRELCEKTAQLYLEGVGPKSKKKLPEKNLCDLLYRVPNLKNTKYKYRYENGGYSWFLSNWKRNPAPTQVAGMENVENKMKFNHVEVNKSEDEKEKEWDREWEEKQKQKEMKKAEKGSAKRTENKRKPKKREIMTEEEFNEIPAVKEVNESLNKYSIN